MAKSKKKQRAEVKNKAQEKQFFKVLSIVTVILLAFLFFVFRKNF